MKVIINENLDTVRNPIYRVDTETKHEMSDLEKRLKDAPKIMRDFVLTSLTGLTTLGASAIIGYKLSETRPEAGLLTLPLAAAWAGSVSVFTDNQKVNNLISYSQLSNAYCPSGGRSALCAEKIEEFIAPKLGAELDEKPDIYLEFVGGHMDIKPYLEHPSLRKSLMAAHNAIGYFPNNGPYRDVVAETRFDELDEDPTNTLDRDSGEKVEYKKTFYEIDGISNGYESLGALKNDLNSFEGLTSSFGIIS